MTALHGRRPRQSDPAPGAIRAPDVVMSPVRVAAAFPSPLSFARSTVARFVKRPWRFSRVRVDLDADGAGSALYLLECGDLRFHFLVVSSSFPAGQKTDHSAGENWDASAALCEGEWSTERETRLLAETPKQRAGRFDYDTLAITRGNRSGRLFDHVVSSLAEGRQPDAAKIAGVGYILRTTGFIANGALGMRPFAGLEPDHPFASPYELQIVSALLLREYVFDLVDTMAAHRGAAAARLDPAYRRYLGIGNAAGAGLVPFVANNPLLIHHWCHAAELALGAARARPMVPHGAETAKLLRLLGKAVAYFTEDGADGNGIFAGSALVAEELRTVENAVGKFVLDGTVSGRSAADFWAEMDRRLAGLHPETIEVFHAITLELLGDEIESYRWAQRVDVGYDVRPEVSIGELLGIVRQDYDWALRQDFDDPKALHHFWYRSAEAPLDPRRGVRGLDPGEAVESRMDIAWKVRRLFDAAADMRPEATVAQLLAARPDFRDLVARLQTVAGLPYADLRDNCLAETYTPFAAIRLNLAFYGMDKLEPAWPKSVKGALLQGAPTMDDIRAGNVDGDWPFPLVPRRSNDASGDGGARGRSETYEDTVAWRQTRSGRLREPAAAEDGLTCSPVEIQRLAVKALQGAGLSLGVAEEAARAIEFSQALHGTGIAGLVAQLDRGRVGPGTIDLGDWPATMLRLRLGGGCAIGVMSSAIDLACAAAKQDRVWSTMILDGAGTAMLDHMVIPAAKNAYLALLTWADASADGKRGAYGLAASGPDMKAGGQWFVSLSFADASAVLALVREIDAGIPSLADTAHLESGAGCMVTALDTEGSGAPRAEPLRQRLLDRIGKLEGFQDRTVLDGSGLASFLWRRQRHGIAVPRSSLAALAKHGQRILVSAGASSGDRGAG